SLSTKSAWTARTRANGSSSRTSPIGEATRCRCFKDAPLWRKPRRRPRERDGIPDMLQLADPLDQPLHAHAETRVRDAPVATGVQVPVVRLRILALFDEGLLDRLEVRFPLAPADDLSDPVATDHVEAEDQIGMLRIPRLVERLCDPRVVRHDDRLRLALRQGSLFQGAQVLPPFEHDSFRLQALQGLVVCEPLERRLDGLQEF